MELAGFGNYPQADVTLARPRGAESLAAQVANAPSLIARGNGRAYGDAALNETITLSMLRHDRLIAFDEISGELTCEAGVLLSDIVTTFTPRAGSRASPPARNTSPSAA